MIGERHRRHPHGLGALHQVGDAQSAVHEGELGVAVEMDEGGLLGHGEVLFFRATGSALAKSSTLARGNGTGPPITHRQQKVDDNRSTFEAWLTIVQAPRPKIDSPNR